MEREQTQRSSLEDGTDAHRQLAERLYEDLTQADQSTSDLGSTVDSDASYHGGLIEVEERRELKRIATALSQTAPPSESGEHGRKSQNGFSIDSESPMLKPGSPNFNPEKCKSYTKKYAFSFELSWRQTTVFQEHIIPF